MKTRVKVAKGEVVYRYKNRYVLEIPEGTYIKAMYYYDDKNRTEIVLKKHRHGVEVICSLLLIFMVLIKILDLSLVSKLYYDSTPIYYDGILYLNIKNTSDALQDVTVELYDMDVLMLRQVLKPGDEFLTINVSDVNKEYILKVKSKNILEKDVYKTVKLVVNNLDNLDFYSEEYTE